MVYRKQRSSLAYEMLIMEKSIFECFEAQILDTTLALDQGLMQQPTAAEQAKDIVFLVPSLKNLDDYGKESTARVLQFTTHLTFELCKDPECTEGSEG